jgi:hypothetical protein
VEALEGRRGLQPQLLGQPGLLQADRLQLGRVGVGELRYLVDPTNRPMLRLLRRLGVELSFRDGLVEGCQPLPGRPAAAA